MIHILMTTETTMKKQEPNILKNNLKTTNTQNITKTKS